MRLAEYRQDAAFTERDQRLETIAYLPRYWNFESISLQRDPSSGASCKPAVPGELYRRLDGLNELAPAFCSDCDDLVEAASAAGVAAWIFGHHHWSLATETHGVRLLSAQLGYPGEDTAGPARAISRFKRLPGSVDRRHQGFGFLP
jgi:hypothetical protein